MMASVAGTSVVRLLLPAGGVRLVPSGKPGANTSRALLPRLVGQGGALKTTPVIRTATGAHHYVLQFLEIDGEANLGFETLIALVAARGLAARLGAEASVDTGRQWVFRWDAAPGHHRLAVRAVDGTSAVQTGDGPADMSWSSARNALFCAFGSTAVAAVVLAVAGLALYVLYTLATLASFDAVLTLPGLAGFVLTIGIAVDANVLVFERIREELRNGNTPQAAIAAGFDRAWATILDSNVTTLIVGLALLVFGSGAVRGFAVVHCLGILTSMFSAVFVSRGIVALIYGNRKKLDRISIGQVWQPPASAVGTLVQMVPAAVPLRLAPVRVTVLPLSAFFVPKVAVPPNSWTSSPVAVTKPGNPNRAPRRC